MLADSRHGLSDCASKAVNALNRLEHVNTSLVSATDGTVTVEVDFEKGNLAEASAILASLGNPPNLPYMQLAGVDSSAIASRHSVPVKGLPRIFRRQPGVLDCDVDRDGNILLQLTPRRPIAPRTNGFSVMNDSVMM